MIEVHLTEQMRSTAGIAEDKIKARLLKKKSKQYTGLESSWAFYYGTLGELAFLELLKQNNIKHQYHSQADGKADFTDFMIFKDGDPYTVDVKTVAAKDKDRFHHIMVPKKQWDGHRKAGIYVGVTMKDWQTAQVWGFAMQGQLRMLPNPPFTVPAMGADMYKLPEIEKLLKGADRND